MSLIIDVIVILAFIASLVAGAKKGFVRSVIRIVIVISAIVGAIRYSPDCAEYLNKKYIEKPVINIAHNSISKLTSDSVNIDMLADEKPNAFLKAINRFGVEVEDIKVFIAANGYTDEEKVDRIAEYMGAPIALALSKVIAFILLFIGIWFVLWIIGKLICLIVKLPILRTADKFLGLLFGTLSGLVFAWGLSIALCHLMPHLAVIYDGFISDKIIENSVIVKYLGSIDHFSLFG